MKRFFFAALLLPLSLSNAHAEQKVLAANKTAKTKSTEVGAADATASTGTAGIAVQDLETVSSLISRDQAIKLAEQHLTLRNNRWGHAVEVRDSEDQFVVVFETPQPESRLIGQRAVTVDKESGLAHVRDRR